MHSPLWQNTAIGQVGNENVTDWGQNNTPLWLSINLQLEMKNDSICNRLRFYLAIALPSLCPLPIAPIPLLPLSILIRNNSPRRIVTGK